MKCANCGRYIKHSYYVEGVGMVGSECFKKLTGQSVQQHKEQKYKKDKEVSLDKFKKENPFIYVCIDKNAYENKERLKELQYNYCSGEAKEGYLSYWIGFKPIDDLETIILPSKYYQGKTEYYYDKKLYGFDDEFWNELYKMTPHSNWIGEVKDKIEIEVTLKNITGYSTNFGWTNIYIFENSNSDILTWKTSKDMDWEKGDRLTIRATIKAHEKYYGEKQTAVLRVKEI